MRSLERDHVGRRPGGAIAWGADDQQGDQWRGFDLLEAKCNRQGT
jgi:hypothetical protein